MAKNPDALAVNDRVSHETYGLGTVTAIDEARTTIQFDDNGSRKFVTSLVRLERTTVAAPAPPSRKSRSKKAAPKAAK